MTAPKTDSKKKTAAAKAAASSQQETVKISVRGFEHKLVDEAAKKIVAVAKDSGADIVGPIPFPTKIERVTVNRSTFIDKNSREQYEIRRHKRVLILKDPAATTLEMLKGVSLPAGVGVEIKVAA